jgi:hypothetical protein
VIFAVRAVITGSTLPVGASHAAPGTNAWFGKMNRIQVQRVEQVARDVGPRPAEAQDLRDAEVELVDRIAPAVVGPMARTAGRNIAPAGATADHPRIAPRRRGGAALSASQVSDP